MLRTAKRNYVHFMEEVPKTHESLSDGPKSNSKERKTLETKS